MFAALLKKDLLCFFRSKGAVLSSLGLGLLLVIISGFAFRRIGISDGELASLSPGVIWLSFLFASIVVINQSFLFERTEGAVNGTILTGVPAGTIFFAKFLANILVVSLIALVIVFSTGIFISPISVGVFFKLFLLASLVSVGFVSIGTLLSVVASHLSAREYVMPLILFPLTLPLFAAAVFVTRLVIDGGEESNFWFSFICIFDLIALSLSWYLFEFLLEE